MITDCRRVRCPQGGCRCEELGYVRIKKPPRDRMAEPEWVRRMKLRPEISRGILPVPS